MNIASLNLTHLLDRLENNLKSPANTKPLLRSQYHRARVGVNIEYARTLLLELEQSALATQTSTKSNYPRNALQTDLVQKRQKLKELKGLLEDIESRAAVEEEIRGLEADSDGEEIVPTPLESEGSRTPADLAGEEEEREKAVTHETPLHEDSRDEVPPAEEAQARLRSRRTIATRRKDATKDTLKDTHHIPKKPRRRKPDRQRWRPTSQRSRPLSRPRRARDDNGLDAQARDATERINAHLPQQPGRGEIDTCAGGGRAG
ncbi:hypothetical protein KEM55_004788 [Ascosphaera atra]|nr:hypothetical protein KEM55_004788 [Ascosphaera atra]